MSKKKYLSLVGAMVLVVGLMQAQIDIGFRSGPTFNTIYQSQSLDAVTPDLDYLIGFSGGVYADIPLSSQLSFQPELAYSQKGFSLAQGADIDLFGAPLPIGVRADTRFDYLDLPLLIKAKFGSDNFKAFVMGGPSIGYALNGRVKTRATAFLNTDITNTSIDLDAINYNRFEVAGVVGAGVEFDANFGKISLDGRFNQGFTQLYDIPLVGENVKNRGFAVNAGIAIPLN